MKHTLFAVHRDGRKLYYPRWDADGEIIPSKLPTAAVTIDSNGLTFPPGSTWIRRPRSSGLLVEVPPKRTVRAINLKDLRGLILCFLPRFGDSAV
jgi:hypothetical protein